MTDTTGSGAEQQAKQEAADNVVETVSSWQHGAEEGTVKEELEKGFDSAGVEVPSDNVESLAHEIHESDGTPDTKPDAG